MTFRRRISRVIMATEEIPVFYFDPTNADISLAGCVKISVKVFVSSRLAPSELAMLDDIPSSGLLGDCGEAPRSSVLFPVRQRFLEGSPMELLVDHASMGWNSRRLRGG